MLAPLLVLTLALPATDQDSHVDIEIGAELFARDNTDEVLHQVTSHALEGGGFADVTLFLRPVHDDDAPPDLQPFLQRLPRLHVNGGGLGGALDTPSQTMDPVVGGYPSLHRSLASGFVTAIAEGYIGWLYLNASLGVSYETWQDSYVGMDLGPPQTVLTLPVDAALGIRWRDILFSAGWSVQPERDNGAGFTVPFWGSAHADVAAAIARRSKLGATVTVLDGGARADGSVEVWIARRLGIWGGIGGGRSAPKMMGSDIATGIDTIAADAGLSAWLSARVAISVGYAIWWEEQHASGTTSSIAHTLTLTLLLRR